MKSLSYFVLPAIAVLLFTAEAISQKVVIVSATQAWSSTGIRATSGQQLLIFARGLYSNGYSNKSAVSWSDPAGRGMPGTGTWQDPNSPIMALIGKIGTLGTPFFVGPYALITPSSTDSLYLGVNDDGSWSDNYGYGVAFIYTSWVPTSVIRELNGQNTTPHEFELEQNFPNPFNPSTTFKYSISRPSHVRLQVFDELGRPVTTLVEGYLQPGNYETEWNGKTSSGLQAATGAYFYQLTSDQSVQAKKMIMIK